MEATSSLLDVIRAILQGWRIILVTIIVCVGMAVGAKYILPEEYQATAVLTVEPLTVSPGAGGAVDMETERVVASSTSVLSEAATALGDQSLAEVQDALVVTIPKGSRILQFTYTASSPQRASDAANAVAEAYREQRTANAQKAVDDTAASLGLRIAELERQLATEKAGSVSARAIELQISSLQERQAALSAATFYPGTIVSPATPPFNPSGPGMLIFVIAGLAFGVLLGLFVAIVTYRIRGDRGRRDLVAGGPVPATAPVDANYHSNGPHTRTSDVGPATSRGANGPAVGPRRDGTDAVYSHADPSVSNGHADGSATSTNERMRLGRRRRPPGTG